MKSTKQIIDEYNEKLFAKLFPKENEPIFCNSVLDPNDEIYNLSFAEIAKKHLEEILNFEDFNLEFEEIKNNLKIE